MIPILSFDDLVCNDPIFQEIKQFVIQVKYVPHRYANKSIQLSLAWFLTEATNRVCCKSSAAAPCSWPRAKT